MNQDELDEKLDAWEGRMASREERESIQQAEKDRKDREDEQRRAEQAAEASRQAYLRRSGRKEMKP